jgi:hypothetical protein
MLTAFNLPPEQWLAVLLFFFFYSYVHTMLGSFLRSVTFLTSYIPSQQSLAHRMPTDTC